MEELPALIVIDCRMAAVTLSGKLLEVIPFWVAVMLLVPSATPVARPVMFTVAIA